MRTKKKVILVLTSLMLVLVPVTFIAYGQGHKPPKPKKVVPTSPKPNPKPKPTPSKPKPKSAPKPTTGTERGHEWVDLGLPNGVKWATCNVGASTPWNYGDYFAWGEITTKSEYTEDNSKTYERDMGYISGNPNYDAARANWGGSWRMPTEKEIEELKWKCKWTWTTLGGNKGYKVVGPNGNSIFLPSAGWRDGTAHDGAGMYGSYWGASPYGGDAQEACFLGFHADAQYMGWRFRKVGRSVRPVNNEKPKETTANMIRYTVKSGDSLDKIAKKYHVTVEEIRQINDLRESRISIGQVLYIPKK